MPDTSPAAKAPKIAVTADAIQSKSGDYTVAPGRTVVNDAGEAKGPGQTVTLDRADAKRLLGLGFLLDDDGDIVIRADGPAVNVEDGVQIAPQA